MGHFGFSYVGLIYLLLLFIPNILWTKKKPSGYTSKDERKILSVFEKAGQVLTSTCALVFSDFNFRVSLRLFLLAMSFLLMLLYEAWWVRYFKSEGTLADFYRKLFFIPLPGAVLPVASFFLLGAYGGVIWMMISAVIFGIGHIGIHYEHYRKALR